MTSVPQISEGYSRRIVLRRRIGLGMQATGWGCGLLTVLVAPFFPLLAILSFPLMAAMGWLDLGAGVIVLFVMALFFLLPLSLCLVDIGGEMRVTPPPHQTCAR